MWINFVLVGILCLLFFLHVLILFKAIPYHMVWGSRLKTDRDMYRFEVASLLISLIFIWLTLEASEMIAGVLPATWNAPIFWVLAAFFALNTLGNFTSQNKLEKWGFGFMTLLITAACIYLAL